MNNEPQGFTDGDRQLAPQSPFHSTGRRKEVTLTIRVMVSAPEAMANQDVYELVEWALQCDPYIRKVEEV